MTEEQARLELDELRELIEWAEATKTTLKN